MKKAHEWLSELGSHEIYDAAKVAEDFKKETGLDPCWHVTDAKAMVNRIKNRGLGGSLKGDQPVTSGYEIAEALAENLAKSTAFNMFSGRGSRFRSALEALKEANI